jgi:hypothetical protein
VAKVMFQVLRAANKKMVVFWVVAPCSLVKVYRRFRGLIALMMEAASTSETSVNFYQTTRRNNLEDSHLLSLWPVLISRQGMEWLRKTTSSLNQNSRYVTRHSNGAPSRKGSLCLYYLLIVYNIK